MKYTGTAKEFKMIGMVSELDVWEGSSSPLKYLYENNLMIDYLLKSDNPTNGLKLPKYYLPNIRTAKTVEYNGKTYTYANVRFGKRGGVQVVFWEGTPNIYVDGPNWLWSYNDKHGTFEYTIKEKFFEYVCVLRGDGSVRVDVKYTKCDNRHRNKVTISEIEIENATNNDIIEAINVWKKELINQIQING